MTHEDLAANWQKYALKTRFGGGLVPLDEKYSHCLGVGPLGVTFQLDRTDGKSPDHFSILRVDANGTCYDEGTTGYGMRVGTLILMS